MEWKAWLAYITGSVGQELLLRNECLVTGNRILRKQVKGHVHLHKHSEALEGIRCLLMGGGLIRVKLTFPLA